MLFYATRKFSWCRQQTCREVKCGERMRQDRIVIIADDDVEIRNEICRILKGSAYVIVAETGNGLELVKLCKEKKPDLVIADIQMPTMNGMEAARQIIEEELSRCVIMLTSYADSFFVQECVDVGVTEYLTKPVDSKILVLTMDRAMEKSRELYLKRREMNKLVRRKKSQSILDRAKLLLMENRGMSEEEAYLFLKNMGKRKQITLEEVARIVIAKMRKL